MLKIVNAVISPKYIPDTRRVIGLGKKSVCTAVGCDKFSANCNSCGLRKKYYCLYVCTL